MTKNDFYLKEGKKPNRLLHEKSPYLLQHAFNPVDWYPWGEEAFEKARKENKPIFLSIGYSTCYWCHVMEREVFENEEIAKLMNDLLVCIKVDREERPDIDRIYMGAVQAMTNSGGWPMSVFLTHDLKPFFGGTYFPPVSHYGRPGFPQVVERIAELWKSERDKIQDSSEHITEYLANKKAGAQNFTLNESVLSEASRRLAQAFDPIFGGFGGAPKFPRPAVFNFLLRYHHRSGDTSALDMTLTTLRKMSEGGMYDHIGGGFHRYSVDEQWRVPHFEKMLYDQAQLVCSYLEAYQITHDVQYSSVANDVLQYVLRNLTGNDGGFFSAEDAESAFNHEHPEDKEEGTFYLWTKSELNNILGSDSELFCSHFGVEDHGNALHDPMSVFQAKNILYKKYPLDETAKQFRKTKTEAENIIKECKDKVFQEREKRPAPHLDDKIITSWNGLMISAFAKGGTILEKKTYLDAAIKAADFILTNLLDAKTTNLRRRYREGEARFDGSLQDYAFFTQGLLDLYEASFDAQYLRHAINLTKKQIELFYDNASGGFFDASINDPSLIVRMKDDYDGAEPTGNSVAALNLLRLAHITTNKEWRSLAEKTIQAYGLYLSKQPEILPQMLVAFDWSLSSPQEIILSGNRDTPEAKSILHEIYLRFLPKKILLFRDEKEENQEMLTEFLPFIKSMTTINEKTTAYVCENFSCQLPTNDPETLIQLLNNEHRKSR